MQARLRNALVAATLASGGSGFACSLDFGRYEPLDGGADAASDSRQGSSGSDTGIVFDAPANESSGCTPRASCLNQATSCAATCSQQYHQCASRCQGDMGCIQDCMSTEQSCGGQCATMCMDCTQSSGCPAMSQCLAASTPQ
jgi:hypothetical protein